MGQTVGVVSAGESRCGLIHRSDRPATTAGLNCMYSERGSIGTVSDASRRHFGYKGFADSDSQARPARMMTYAWAGAARYRLSPSGSCGNR